MTPDELRRMDNDLCIIFEKGIKPIKAKKFYYFKHSMAKKLEQVAISHNNIGDINRGTWRKYNPYNPYVEEEDNDKKAQDLKVESLDDLFEDEPKTEKPDVKPKLKSENKVNAPILPMEENEEEEEMDLQKELEAKFDELFGPIEDE